MSQTETNSVEAPEVFSVVEHLFRQESGRMVATLARIFGIEHLSLAEDVVQEALARALQTWPYYGVPENPAAWILRTSRNLALDVVRRERVFRGKEPEIARLIEEDNPEAGAVVFADQEIADDRLRLMFVCCHPAIPQESQTALALKTLGGFGIPEIARAFLTTDAAIAKRLTRAKRALRQARVPFEIPAGPQLAGRLDGVLQSLYLLFNEGYKASSGDRLVREDVCQEAIRLATLLAEHPAGRQPRVRALLALMLLNAARLRTRSDSEGNLLRLQEQDRSQWDRQMISRGLFYLAQSAEGDEISEYHLQAGIAACHCLARDYAATDWRQILALYDRLAAFDPSPVVALNRAIAVAEVHGPEAGVAAVNSIPHLRSLDSYYLRYAALGELEWRRDHRKAAAGHFEKARQLATHPSEQAFLARRLEACREGAVCAPAA